jgi:hypothetical protein
MKTVAGREPLWLERAQEARRQADRCAAAMAYLDGLAEAPMDQRPLNGLYFLGLDLEERRRILPRLQELLALAPERPLARCLLAHWFHDLGERERSLAISREVARTGIAPHRLRPDAAVGAGGQPDALIIGAPKSATTSLAAYLCGHPALWVHPLKELHFFDNHWERGEEWYRAQFPSLRRTGSIVRLEATPDYLQTPEAPARVQSLLPEVRLIVVLREPLARAVSWIGHMRTQVGLEGETEALLRQEMENLEALDPDERAQLGWFFPNALSGSLYADQLGRWRKHVPAERILVLSFEALVLNPEPVLRRVLAFLDQDPGALPPGRTYVAYNSGRERLHPIDPTLARRCRDGVLAEAMELWMDL